MNTTIRLAELSDVPVLESLIAKSARALGRPDYTEAQIEAALGTAWGVDTQLIQDRTFYIVEADGRAVACGGWSYRQALFGGERQLDRQSLELDPHRDSARIRAFFVAPEWVRRGLGRQLLEQCETAARARGFKTFELVATLPGRKLYQSFGYEGEKRVEYPLKDGVTIEFIPMRKIIS